MTLFFAWFLFCLLSAGWLFSFSTEQVPTRRMHAMDGLRFVLAALVVFHHNLYSYHFYHDGKWQLHITEYPVEFIGNIAVSLFFIISGYLFGNLNKNTDWLHFFKKRIFRIAPLALLSSLLCVGLAIAIGTYKNNSFNLTGLGYYFDMGITNIRPPLYGIDYTYLINAGVTWTLQWEWLFYFTIPAITLLTNQKNRAMICLLIIAWAAYFGTSHDYVRAAFLILFCIGILIRNTDTHALSQLCSRYKLATNMLLVILMAGLPFIVNNAMSVPTLLMEGLIFLLVVYGCDMFGLLSSKGFRVLGEASYSIYLLHGIVWFVMNGILFKHGIESTPYLYYGIQTIVWYMICYISLLSYRHIELPFIKMGAGQLTIRRQKTEDRRQKTEDRRQKTEDRRQKTEDRRQKTEEVYNTTDTINSRNPWKFYENTQIINWLSCRAISPCPC
ncbi:acyltransferase family protein (plasmid) [Edwardsiella tarda]|uniref:acyltransferase family protein n=1 Tax=Edwardsiella tarda TaxID=636 RepID=UPI002443E8D7|nr:acyltransferase family protein [Edwardsiella tarda]WGE30895.1 acyltransferase family protein [Edwardsiella tarda]